MSTVRITGNGQAYGAFLEGFHGRGEDNEIPASMLDNSPLRDFLTTAMDLKRLKYNIDHSDIRAVCVNRLRLQERPKRQFFSGRAWRRGLASGTAGWSIRTELSVDHLMASSAIPTIFPPVKIHREYFGDGLVRNILLSPAIHLGADRIPGYWVSANRVLLIRRPAVDFPKLPQIMEHLLNGAFIDVVENDIDKAFTGQSAPEPDTGKHTWGKQHQHAPY